MHCVCLITRFLHLTSCNPTVGCKNLVTNYIGYSIWHMLTMIVLRSEVWYFCSAAFESVERDLRRVKMRNVEIHSLVSAESRKRDSFPKVE